MGASRKRANETVSPRRPSLRGYVSETGRLSLPAELRRAIGLESGGPVRIAVVDGDIRIRTIKQVKDRIRALARDSGLADKASVADFLSQSAAERMKEREKAGKQ
jgi:AbrB family looped-hinge helix DNA binding protein